VISKSKDAKTVRWSLETDEVCGGAMRGHGVCACILLTRACAPQYQVVIKPRKQSSSDWCPLDIRCVCVCVDGGASES
jgi:hypothetical protein